jgi:hypothetical protein
MKTLTLAFWLITAPAAAQVAVSVRLDKPTFFSGEPVFVLVEVKNIGSEPVAYSGGDGRITMSVANGEIRKVPRLSGCFNSEIGGGSMGGVGHPPLLKPGSVATFRSLLRDYRLRPGTYDLRVWGKADVRWKSYPDPNSRLPMPTPLHKETDPVPGEMFDRTLRLVIVSGSADDLAAVYAPYVAVAFEFGESGFHGRHAIFEMAPAFLEPTIAKLAHYFGNEQSVAAGAAAALGEINSASSRAELVRLFDSSRDLDVRSSVVLALAKTGHSDALAFFSSVLPGRSTEPDDRIRRHAALGIGRIGGDAAVAALRAASASPNPLVTGAVLEALGNTKTRSAVPVLIDRARGPNGNVLNEVCGALTTLTHRAWCDGSADVQAMQVRWRRWWADNGASTPIYGPEECPTPGAPLPELR